MGLLSLNVTKNEQCAKTATSQMLSQSEEITLLSASHCVFDSSEHESAQTNLTYMAKEFGFVVPKEELLQDVGPFLTYLGQRVGVRNACLACDSSFEDTTAVQKHMRDAAHCRITADDGSMIAEYAQFFSFETDASLAEGGDVPRAGVKEELILETDSGSNPFLDKPLEGEIAEGNEEVDGETVRISLPGCFGKDRKASLGDKASNAVRDKASAVVQKQAKAVVRKQATNLVRRHAVGIAGRAAIGVVGGPAVAVVGGTILTVMTAKAVIDASGKAIEAVKEARAEDSESSTEEVKV